MPPRVQSPFAVVIGLLLVVECTAGMMSRSTDDPMVTLILSKLRSTQPRTQKEANDMRQLASIIIRALDNTSSRNSKFRLQSSHKLRGELKELERQWRAKFGGHTVAPARPRLIRPLSPPAMMRSSAAARDTVANRLQHSLVLLQKVMHFRDRPASIGGY